MLPPARRLWGRRERDRVDGRRSQLRVCSLSALERSVLGFHRVGDVPGLRDSRRATFTSCARAMPRVDRGRARAQPSRSAVAGRRDGACVLAGAAKGREACREPARAARRSGASTSAPATSTRAVDAYELAARGERARRAARTRWRGWRCCCGATGRHDEAAAAWQGVLDLARATRRPLTALERRAAEALAIHHEHRARDLAARASATPSVCRPTPPAARGSERRAPARTNRSETAGTRRSCCRPTR